MMIPAPERTPEPERTPDSARGRGAMSSISRHASVNFSVVCSCTRAGALGGGPRGVGVAAGGDGGLARVLEAVLELAHAGHHGGDVGLELLVAAVVGRLLLARRGGGLERGGRLGAGGGGVLAQAAELLAQPVQALVRLLGIRAGGHQLGGEVGEAVVDAPAARRRSAASASRRSTALESVDLDVGEPVGRLDATFASVARSQRGGLGARRVELLAQAGDLLGRAGARRELAHRVRGLRGGGGLLAGAGGLAARLLDLLARGLDRLLEPATAARASPASARPVLGQRADLLDQRLLGADLAEHARGAAVDGGDVLLGVAGGPLGVARLVADLGRLAARRGGLGAGLLGAAQSVVGLGGDGVEPRTGGLDEGGDLGVGGVGGVGAVAADDALGLLDADQRVADLLAGLVALAPGLVEPGPDLLVLAAQVLDVVARLAVAVGDLGEPRVQPARLLAQLDGLGAQLLGLRAHRLEPGARLLGLAAGVLEAAAVLGRQARVARSRLDRRAQPRGLLGDLLDAVERGAQLGARGLALAGAGVQRRLGLVGASAQALELLAQRVGAVRLLGAQADQLGGRLVELRLQPVEVRSLRLLAQAGELLGEAGAVLLERREALSQSLGVGSRGCARRRR